MKSKKFIVIIIITICFFTAVSGGLYYYLIQSKLASVVNTAIRNFQEVEIRAVKINAKVDVEKKNQRIKGKKVNTTYTIDMDRGYCRFEQAINDIKTVQYYTAEGEHYYHLASESDKWFKEKSSSFANEYNGLLNNPDEYLDTDDITFKLTHYSNYKEKRQEDGTIYRKISVDGRYVRHSTTIDFKDIWWIKGNDNSIVKCKSKEIYKNKKMKQTVNCTYSFKQDHEVEQANDIPEDLIDIPWRFHPVYMNK